MLAVSSLLSNYKRHDTVAFLATDQLNAQIPVL